MELNELNKNLSNFLKNNNVRELMKIGGKTQKLNRKKFLNVARILSFFEAYFL